MNESAADVNQARHEQTSQAAGPAAPLVVGRVLRERYVLQARLGTGDSGTVFKALDRFRAALPEAHQYVALKVLHAGEDCSAETLAEFRRAFHSAQVLSHRNIVNVHEVDRDGDVVFFTMELLDGEPLADLLERLRPRVMRKSQARELIRQLGSGLAHAHERGVVHGGLSPQNIFITVDGELRLLNFGSAAGSDAAAYASCEQLEGRRADPRGDLYAVACISYALLAGTHPFGLRLATLARDYRVPLVRPEGLTGRQWRALQKGLSWHRGGRSISVRSWMHRLIGGSVRGHSITPLQELMRPNPVQSKISWRAAAAALLLVMTITTAAVLAQIRSTAPSKVIGAPSSMRAASVMASAPAADRDLAAVPPDRGPATRAAATHAGDAAGKPISSGAPRAKSAERGLPFKISVEPTQVKSDDHFAEIRIHRNELQKNSSFTWWTEPATAKPDVDYVPEAVAIQTFPSGYRTARLYVRILPQSLRSQRSYFYIAIAASGQQQGPPIRQQVWLPRSSSLQAQR